MNPASLVPALRRLLARPEAGGSSDAQLLHRFVNQRDESAFELLVWRHGPMILGVCRRILRDEHDAEDAFQATLLALARKAGTIGKHESVGSWLWKVAYRVALRARGNLSRRSRHERTVPNLPAVADPSGTAATGWQELRPVLDEELNRLAEKHRAPVVLCYLEGLTNEEAARQLRCPVGTLKTRLAHARRMLGERLARRGLALGAGLLATEAIGPASAAVPAALVGATVRIATASVMGKIATAGAASAQVIALTEGVLRAMMVTKLKQAAVALMVGLAFVGAGTMSVCALAAGPVEGERNQAESPRVKATPAETRVSEIKNRISELTAELRRAEEQAARERAVPPRQKPVAVIFGNVPITREELAEHLLSRMTGKQLEKYINRRIMEYAARREGISVTAEEVEDHFKSELARANMQERAFRARMRDQHMTLREWKEDVVRSQLLLKKLSAGARVDEKVLRMEFEKRYGPKVQCEIIVFPSQQRDAARCAARRLREGETTFEQEVKRFPPGSHRVPLVVSRHSTPCMELEKAAFALRVGEVSAAIDVGESIVIVKCVGHIAADRATRFEDVREKLKRELQEVGKQQGINRLFQSLKAEAKVRMLWTPVEEKEEGER